MSMEIETLAPDLAVGASALVDDLVNALINSGIYFEGHPRVDASIDALKLRLAELRRNGAEAQIRLSIMETFFVFGREPLLSASLSAGRLVKAFDKWQAGGVEFENAAGEEGLRALFAILKTNPAPGDDHTEANRRIAARNGAGVRLLPPNNLRVEGGVDVSSLDSFRRMPMHLYQSIIEDLQGVTLNVCQGRSIPFDAVQAQAEQVIARLSSEQDTMMNLARREQYDAFTFGHSVRVTVLTLNFARGLTDDPEYLLRLGTAALLHDVGKSLIPMEILHSREKLTPEEREEINRHPEYGARILMDHREATPMDVSVAFGHHKTLENAGYPQTLHNHRLSRATRVVKICDTYEALTAARPYKRPMSPTRAYRVMMSMENHFDLELLSLFIRINGVYPGGQYLELSTGAKARVIRQSGELLAPVVKVLTDPEGNTLREEDKFELDLSLPTEGPAVTVASTIQEEWSILLG